jgi:hypothetical protein
MLVFATINVVYCSCSFHAIRRKMVLKAAPKFTLNPVTQFLDTATLYIGLCMWDSPDGCTGGYLHNWGKAPL